MKKQTRFTSERSIHAEINSNLRRINALGVESDELEVKGHELIRTGNLELIDTGKDLLKQADTIRNSTIPRINSKLQKLKEALASFNTMLLPGISGDQGVSL